MCWVIPTRYTKYFENVFTEGICIIIKRVNHRMHTQVELVLHKTMVRVYFNFIIYFWKLMMVELICFQNVIANKPNI